MISKTHSTKEYRPESEFINSPHAEAIHSLQTLTVPQEKAPLSTMPLQQPFRFPLTDFTVVDRPDQRALTLRLHERETLEMSTTVTLACHGALRECAERQTVGKGVRQEPTASWCFTPFF